jgi:hypothetical protein
MNLIQPKEITLKVMDAQGEIRDKVFILSKFPAIQGREIIAKYPVSNMPKVGEYAVSEEVMLKLMSFVAVDTGGVEPLRLNTQALVNNHASDWETLAKIEWAMIEYNCSFFQNGRLSNFLRGFALTSLPKVLEMLTTLSAQSSQADKQR